MHQDDTTPKVFGLLAEFDSATAIVDAARKTRQAGYTKIDTFTPFPIHELDAALKLP
ncbi:quinol:electron acceptor oxidoreductase subunit ActD, partial [Enterococcus casseliflavus]|uniref:quinol:electron acceptor oxidoreductase subunit ActD n=1 Tax=Enterococcus casseliflavus TaxID=37734 RepID=UPI003D0A605C